MLSRWVVGVALLFGILLFMLPKSDEQSLSRIASTSMLSCTKDIREQAARHVLRQENISLEFRNGCPELIASLEISGQGEMVITGNKYPLVMRLRPVVESGRVRWSCLGEPMEMITRLCQP